MADILKISTPLVERTPTQAVRPAADPSVPFNLSDVTRVIQATDPSEIFQQNTGLVPNQSDTPKILADLLRDPAVAASMIRGISLLQEVLNLVPAQNAALTQEIGQLFDALLMKPEDIAAELMRQEQSTTMFKGDFFDALRDILLQNPQRPDVATGVGVLLKALNAAVSRQDVLQSVSHNLAFLADSLQVSPHLSGRLQNLVDAFRAPNAGEKFPQLKEDALAALREVNASVLFTPAMEKVLPLVVYNLSRYNDSEEFLPQALNLLLPQLDGDAQKLDLVDKLQAFLDRYVLGQAGGPARSARAAEEESQVIDTLAKIIGKQAKSEDIRLLSGDKVEKIIHSLLASPSNFTPLLHFIVPVEYQDLRAFAEIWIDPNAQSEADKRGNTQGGARMLLVFDVEGIGRFESELFVHEKRISLHLFCPPAHVDAFREVGPALRKTAAELGYRFEEITVDRLEHTRSLMDVFTDLPHKRTGIDVKV